jgi:hypothetical protein
LEAWRISWILAPSIFFESSWAAVRRSSFCASIVARMESKTLRIDSLARSA